MDSPNAALMMRPLTSTEIYWLSQVQLKPRSFRLWSNLYSLECCAKLTESYGTRHASERCQIIYSCHPELEKCKISIKHLTSLH